MQEAGGCLSGMKGEPVSLRGPNIVADNGSIHAGMVELFLEIFEGKYRYPLPVMPGGQA